MLIGLLKFIKKIFGGVADSAYTPKQEPKQEKQEQVKPVAKEEIDYGKVKPKIYYNKTISPEESIRQKTYDDLFKNRVLNFGFIAEKQNYKNIRSFVCFAFQNEPYPFVLWQKTRDEEEELVDCKCVVCGSSGTTQVKEWKKDDKGKTIFDSNNEPIAVHYKHHTEAHEQWYYNDKKRLAVLYKIMSLCPECHKVAHINRYAHDKEKFNELSARYCLVNGLILKNADGQPILDENGTPKLNIAQFKKDYDFALKEKERRKEIVYNLEISKWLNVSPAYKYKGYFEDNGYLQKIEKKIISKKTGKEKIVYDWVFDCSRQDFNAYINKEFITSEGVEE